jgi:hypothetical protein
MFSSTHGIRIALVTAIAGWGLAGAAALASGKGGQTNSSKSSSRRSAPVPSHHTGASGTKHTSAARAGHGSHAVKKPVPGSARHVASAPKNSPAGSNRGRRAEQGNTAIRTSNASNPYGTNNGGGGFGSRFQGPNGGQNNGSGGSNQGAHGKDWGKLWDYARTIGKDAFGITLGWWAVVTGGTDKKVAGGGGVSFGLDQYLRDVDKILKEINVSQGGN